jgi:two-component system CheB/CheR fusion protein
MPADSGMAFVLVQHLDPTHESLGAELIGRHTSMPVVEVRAEMPVEENCVYVIPPNRYLTISGGTLHLTEPLERRGLRVPIDFFLRSLAQDQQERAIGIILSGTGTDGTLGVREIKAVGGIVVAQSPETCQFDGMPRSAINTGVVDYILPVEKMPAALIDYLRHWQGNGQKKQPPAAEEAPDHLPAILGLLRARVKYDFSCYKKGTLVRRIQRRMGLHRIADMSEYVDYLRKNKDDLDALYRDLLIGVTNFFRDPEAWETLEQQVVVPLIADCDPHAPLRAWVAGCATGEEAYSLAMVLIEQLQVVGKGCAIQVFASDIDPDALQIARAGVYPENIAADVSPERLRRFFIADEHSYRVNKQVREAVVFAQQNVISDPPFSKLDLITCRNLLIYLEAPVQKTILSLFHFGLRPGGYLFLGGSETISQQRGMFEPISRKNRIYRRIGQSSPDRMELPVRVVDGSRPSPGAHPKWDDPNNRRLASVAQQLVLQRFVPACVLINQKAEVLHLNGPIDRYLRLPDGNLASDLMAMAREGVRTKLRSAVHQALRDGKAVRMSGARVKVHDKHHDVLISVEPLKHPPEAAGLLLVTFEEEETHKPDGRRSRAPAAAPPETLAASDYEDIIGRLEGDLRTTRGDLQSTIEDLETSNQEFKAANEEVTSVNEELQSTNEELETSKEELQSLNEELQTVNNQLEQKVIELETAHDDLANLLASTDIPIVFLDRQFCIKRFTPATTRLMPLIQEDVGRPVNDFAWNFSDPDLLGDARGVLEKLSPLEREIQDKRGRWYLRRIAPYRTEDSHIGGVVIVFTDITARREHAKTLEALAAELKQRVVEGTSDLAEKQGLLAAMLDSTTEAVIVIDKDRRYQFFNPAAQELFDFDPAQRPDARWPDHYGETWRAKNSPQLPDELPTARAFRGEVVRNEEIFLRNKRHPDGVWIQLNSSPQKNDAGEVVNAISIGHDITEQRRSLQDRARLAAVMQDASASIWIIALDGTIRVWNRGAERLLGYKADEIVDRNVSIILPPDRSDDFARTREQLLRTHAAEASETVRLHKDGSRVDVVITESLVETGDHIDGIYVMAQDIRERKRVEHQFAELTEAERQRIGHELHDTLGQQLSAIGMIVSTVKDQLGDRVPQAASMTKLEALVEQTKTQLRSVAKGLVPVDVDATGLRIALSELAAEIRRVHKIDCRLEYPKSLTLDDSFVATQLYLIAREAVHNAVKHAKPRQIVVRMEDSDGMRLSIRDDGIGLASRPASAGGMGLHIMRHRSSLIGAALRIEPADGTGTIVTCSLWKAK